MDTGKLLNLVSERCKDKTTLEAVADLFSKFNVDWFTLDGSDEPLFICQSLAVAKGLNSDDFNKHYLPNLLNQLPPSNGGGSGATSKVYPASASQLSLTSTKLVDDSGTIEYCDLGVFLAKGEYLQIAKQECPNSVGKRSSSVYICHWERAAHYLAQGYSDAAKETVALMSEATRRQVEQEKTPIELGGFYKEAQNLNKNPAYRFGGERWLQQQFLLIAAHTDLKFRAEYGLYFDGKQRFLDLLRKLPRKLQVIEFSLPAVTVEKVKDKLITKEYPAALANRHGNRLQEYIFSSPFGITNDALSLIDKLNGQTIGGVKVKVIYKPFGNLIEGLVQNAYGTTPSACHWRLEEDLAPLLNALPDRCNPQLPNQLYQLPA